MNLAKALEIASATHTGMVRAHNEDAIATDRRLSRNSATTSVVPIPAYWGWELADS